jgi:hypothetical protein
MYFCVDGKEVSTSVGFKRLPQELAPSPFSYSFYTSEVDRCLPENCRLMQFNDDLAVNSSHYHSKVAQRQTQI